MLERTRRYGGKLRREGFRTVRRSLAYRLDPPVPQPDPITPLPGVFDWLRRRRYTIVQIGAFVGDSIDDPLFAFLRSQTDGTAVLVEPVKDYYDELRATYVDEPHVMLENVAIAESVGEREIHRITVDPTDYGHPEWLERLSSLRPDAMREVWERFPELHEFWLHHSALERVQCITFGDLLDRHGLEHVDLLQIDTEGYDYEILRTIDFERVRPRFINYERVLLHDDEPACRELLKSAGYVLVDWGADTLAVAVCD